MKKVIHDKGKGSVYDLFYENLPLNSRILDLEPIKEIPKSMDKV
jgi:hypothetical protein